MSNRHLLSTLTIATVACVTLIGGQPARGADAPDNGAAPPHQGIDCRRCHLQAAEADTDGLLAASRCGSCHPGQQAGSDQALGFHTGGAIRNCLECHSFHSPSTVTTGLGQITLAALAGLDRAHCRSCHTPDSDLAALSDAHRAAARLYHEQAASLQDQSPSQACLNCHSGSGATAWQGQAEGKVLAFSEHASHPFAVEVVPGRGSFAHRIRREIDPRVPLFDQRIECQTCHAMTSTRDNLLGSFETPKDLCLGCHQFRDQPLESSEDFLATMVRR